LHDETRILYGIRVFGEDIGGASAEGSSAEGAFPDIIRRPRGIIHPASDRGRVVENACEIAVFRMRRPRICGGRSRREASVSFVFADKPTAERADS